MEHELEQKRVAMPSRVIREDLFRFLRSRACRLRMRAVRRCSRFSSAMVIVPRADIKFCCEILCQFKRVIV